MGSCRISLIVCRRFWKGPRFRTTLENVAAGTACRAPDMERPVNYECCFFFLPGPEAGWVAIEEAISTIDQSDIRGSSRIIVIRRELPRTTSAGWVLRPTA